MSQIQVMGTIFNQHSNEAVAYVAGNPACSPGIKGTVTMMEQNESKNSLRDYS